jgi:hypothetical protein
MIGWYMLIIPAFQVLEAGRGSEASLSYIVSSRPSWTIWIIERDKPVSKKEKEKKKRGQKLLKADGRN